jgi:L-fucose isomerase
MKPYWEVTPAEAKACLDATTWHCGMLEYFRGGGWSTRFRTKGGMPVTMCRINLVKGLGPPCKSSKAGQSICPMMCTTPDERTNPTWPTAGLCPPR